MMPPKSNLKRKAQQASHWSVEARKKQRLSSVESIAAAVEMTPSSSLSARVEETVSSQVSSAMEAPSSISAHTITTFTSNAGLSFVGEAEETDRIGEAEGGEGRMVKMRT